MHGPKGVNSPAALPIILQSHLLTITEGKGDVARGTESRGQRKGQRMVRQIGRVAHAFISERTVPCCPLGTIGNYLDFRYSSKSLCGSTSLFSALAKEKTDPDCTDPFFLPLQPTRDHSGEKAINRK